MASNVGMCRNDKGRCINPIQRPQIWCGEGDLNPQGLLKIRKLMILQGPRQPEFPKTTPFLYKSCTRRMGGQ
jgi:hypothetical protein